MSTEEFETIKYENGAIAIDVYLSRNGEAWVSQNDMASLFSKDRTSVGYHIQKIYSDGFLSRGGTCEKIPQVRPEGTRSVNRSTTVYSMPIVLEVGHRIGSNKGRKLAEWIEDYKASKSPSEGLSIIYDNGDVALDIRVSPEEETVWMSQSQIADLFNTTKQNVWSHIQNIYQDQELEPGATIKYFLTVQLEGGRSVARDTEYFNLDMILAVGYRVRSPKASAFRAWATRILKRYMTHGYALNEKRLLSTENSLKDLSAKVLSLDEEMQRNATETNRRLTILEKLLEREEIPNESLFYDNQIFDARTFLRNLFSRAEKEILIIDPYADEKTLSLLTSKRKEVTILLAYGEHAKLSPHDIDAFNQQYGGLTITHTDAFHDRFLFIDESCYLLGSSINHIGKKATMLLCLHDTDIIATIHATLTRTLARLA